MAAFRAGKMAILIVASAANAACTFRSGSEAQSGSSSATADTQAVRIPIGPSQLQALRIPRTQSRQVGSLLNIDAPLDHGRYVWNDEGVADGPIAIRVDRRTQLISVFRAGHEIGTAVILYGADEKPTPTGEFRILNKIKDHRSSLYGSDMPYTLRLTDDGVAIHGSSVRMGAATHGCVGVPIEFAALLFQEARRGDLVVII